jgi:hypothetical protein
MGEDVTGPSTWSRINMESMAIADGRRDPEADWPELQGAYAGIARMIEAAPDVMCQERGSG